METPENTSLEAASEPQPEYSEQSPVAAIPEEIAPDVPQEQEQETATGNPDNAPDSKVKTPAPETIRILEAVLFASDEVLPLDKLKSILPGQPDARKIRQLVDTLNQQLQKQRHPFEVVEIGGGYQFRTVSYYYQWVQQLFKEKTAKKLSIQSLECLAIISYKQPITKAEIEAVRGVISDGAMKTLLEKHLVTIAGRSEKAGRPLLYATTKEFLSYFGLNKLADLPKIEEFEALAKEKLGELSEAELVHIESEKGAEESEPGAEAAAADEQQGSAQTVPDAPAETLPDGPASQEPNAPAAG